MVIQMRPIFFTLLFLSSIAFAQEINQEEVEVKSVEDASAINDSVNDPAQTEEPSQQNVPANLESGYKGFAWGTSAGSNILNNFTPLPTTDSTITTCLLYTSPSPRDATLSRMPSSA